MHAIYLLGFHPYIRHDHPNLRGYFRIENSRFYRQFRCLYLICVHPSQVHQRVLSFGVPRDVDGYRCHAHGNTPRRHLHRVKKASGFATSHTCCGENDQWPLLGWRATIKWYHWVHWEVNLVTSESCSGVCLSLLHGESQPLQCELLSNSRLRSWLKTFPVTLGSQGWSLTLALMSSVDWARHRTSVCLSFPHS